MTPLWQERRLLTALACFALGASAQVTGKVAFTGTAPKAKVLSMDADPVCAAKNAGPVKSEVIVVNANGTLKNVFVYVKKGLEGKTFPTPTAPAILDQDGCVYKPHVVALMVKQPLQILTKDKTPHNIHPLPQANAEFNISQAAGAGPITQSFAKPELNIPVVCNQHPWMRAIVHVVTNPYHAITGDDGSFTIKGLPPGKYTLEAIHERYGAKTLDIVVAAGKPATANFSYSAAQ